VSFPEKFWPLWPPLQWPSLKQKCPSPHRPKTLMLSFFYLAFLAPFKKKKGVRALEVCWVNHPIFFCFNLNIKSYENSQKPSPRTELWVPLQLSISLPVLWIPLKEGIGGERKGWNKVTLLITLIKLLDLVVWIIILSCLEWTKNQMCYRVW
jgi:hypothetical protein